jgi:flagellar capping protein FliD
VSTMLSGGTDDASDYSDDLGLAQDISIELATILSSEGILSQREVAANSRVSDYDVELALLATRLDVTYQRYLRQFALMESFVQKSNGIGDYLKGQFEAMENMYRN